MQASKPGLKVLYTSGYDTARLAKEFPPGERVNFVQKPFHARRLAEMVYDCLNSGEGGNAGKTLPSCGAQIVY